MAVDVVGQLHEPEPLAQGPLYPPGQVRRVDRQAVTTHAGPRAEPHVPERLAGRGVDRLPHVDADALRVNAYEGARSHAARYGEFGDRIGMRLAELVRQG